MGLISRDAPDLPGSRQMGSITAGTNKDAGVALMTYASEEGTPPPEAGPIATHDQPRPGITGC